MSLINDEILNDYVDNNLSASEISKLNKSISEDEKELIKLRAHKFIHQTLKEITVYEAPQYFTQKIMSKISETVSIAYEAGKFFKFVIGVFILLITGLVVYSFQLPEEKSQAFHFSFKNDLIDKFLSLIPNISSQLNSSTILMIGSGLIVILLVTSFYMMESHLNFKKKIEHFTK